MPAAPRLFVLDAALLLALVAHFPGSLTALPGEGRGPGASVPLTRLVPARPIANPEIRRVRWREEVLNEVSLLDRSFGELVDRLAAVEGSGGSSAGELRDRLAAYRLQEQALRRQILEHLDSTLRAAHGARDPEVRAALEALRRQHTAQALEWFRSWDGRRQHLHSARRVLTS